VGVSFWGNEFPGSVPKPPPPPPERGGVEGKQEDTPPSSRFWMELEGGGAENVGREKEAGPRGTKGACVDAGLRERRGV